MYLQNITTTGAVVHQEVAVAPSRCKKLLGSKGAYCVHGGGFAGTVQAFVPVDLPPKFQAEMENVLGEGKCHVAQYPI